MLDYLGGVLCELLNGEIDDYTVSMSSPPRTGNVEINITDMVIICINYRKDDLDDIEAITFNGQAYTNFLNYDKYWRVIGFLQAHDHNVSEDMLERRMFHRNK